MAEQWCKLLREVVESLLKDLPKSFERGPGHPALGEQGLDQIDPESPSKQNHPVILLISSELRE